MPRVNQLVEREFAIFQRQRFGKPDIEVDRVMAFSQDHAIYLAKTKGIENIGNALCTDGELYKRYHSMDKK